MLSTTLYSWRYFPFLSNKLILNVSIMKMLLSNADVRKRRDPREVMVQDVVGLATGLAGIPLHCMAFGDCIGGHTCVS